MSLIMLKQFSYHVATIIYHSVDFCEDLEEKIVPKFRERKPKFKTNFNSIAMIKIFIYETDEITLNLFSESSYLSQKYTYQQITPEHLYVRSLHQD